jgi:hypothetical protein
MNNILLCDNCSQPFNTVESFMDLVPINEEREEQGLEPLQFRPPLILHHCGCTFCGSCLMEIIDGNKQRMDEMPEDLSPEEQEDYARQHMKACPTCGLDIIEEAAGECRRNQKLINFLSADDAQPIVHGSIESIPCPKHPTKIIDYFCKTCSQSVCSKCIYDDHNGHSLMQVDEMSNSLK